ncbi:DUF5993 family protein [Legionella micdadei]
MTLLYLLYWLIGLQIVFKPNRFLKPQFLFCLLLTLFWFDFHGDLLGYE